MYKNYLQWLSDRLAEILVSRTEYKGFFITGFPEVFDTNWGIFDVCYHCYIPHKGHKVQLGLTQQESTSVLFQVRQQGSISVLSQVNIRMANNNICPVLIYYLITFHLS